MMLRVLACQVDIPPTPDSQSRDAHLARLEALIDAALDRQAADLVVLPELSSIDYSRDSFERLDGLAEELDGPSCAAMTRLAGRHGVQVVFGMPRRLAGNRYRIAQVLIGPGGAEPRYYDKIHIAQYGASMEKEFFEPGGHLCVFNAGGLNVAPIICYDIRIPELTRTLCRRYGVDLVLHCGAYYQDESFASWHHFVVTRAMENQVWVLSLNRAGDAWGASVLCPPWYDAGSREPVFSAREELRHLLIDPDYTARIRARYPFLEDMRSDYAALPVESEDLA